MRSARLLPFRNEGKIGRAVDALTHDQPDIPTQ
jgi:hypothetical protein